MITSSATKVGHISKMAAMLMDNMPIMIGMGNPSDFKIFSLDNGYLEIETDLPGVTQQMLDDVIANQASLVVESDVQQITADLTSKATITLNPSVTNFEAIGISLVNNNRQNVSVNDGTLEYMTDTPGEHLIQITASQKTGYITITAV